jgi:hypothetical protein
VERPSGGFKRVVSPQAGSCSGVNLNQVFKRCLI